MCLHLSTPHIYRWVHGVHGRDMKLLHLELPWRINGQAPRGRNKAVELTMGSADLALAPTNLWVVDQWALMSVVCAGVVLNWFHLFVGHLIRVSLNDTLWLVNIFRLWSRGACSLYFGSFSSIANFFQSTFRFWTILVLFWISIRVRTNSLNFRSNLLMKTVCESYVLLAYVVGFSYRIA